MERYDGKTRKDDIRKWTIIITIAVLLLAAFVAGTHFMKRSTAPDYTVVDMSQGTFTEATEKYIEEIVGPIVGDKNRNGNVKINIKSVMPEYFGGYDTNTAALFTGDYVLFFIADPSPWNSDILAEKIDLEGTALWETLDLNSSALPYLSVCILNTNDADMEEAQRIVDAIMNDKAGT